MTTAAGTTAVHDYLLRLRAELADLPPGEVEDILGDVGVQLAESGDELGRLGSPETYAAELRTAAGYPPAPIAAASDTGVPLGPRVGLRLLALGSVAALPVGFYGFAAGSGTALVLALVLLVALPVVLGWLLVQERTGLRALPEAVAVCAARERVAAALPPALLELLRALRPAWWVLRAVLAAVLVSGALSYTTNLSRVGVLGVVLALPSVWLGLRAATSRLWRWTTLPLDVVAVGVGLAVLLGAGPPLVSYADATSYNQPVSDFASLPAYNVYPFDAAGNPLTGVYLFDQQGQPIRLYANPCYDGSYETTSGQDAGSNVYPLPNVVNDPQTGRCVTVPGVPFTALVPRASGTPTTAPVTTAPVTTAPVTTAPVTTAPVTTSPAPSPSSGVGSAPTTLPATATAVPTG